MATENPEARQYYEIFRDAVTIHRHRVPPDWVLLDYKTKEVYNYIAEQLIGKLCYENECEKLAELEEDIEELEHTKSDLEEEILRLERHIQKMQWEY